jgi:hypothetical protein
LLPPAQVLSLCQSRQARAESGHDELHGVTRVPPDRLLPAADPPRLAVAAYLARFSGSSRDHTESDLRCYLSWCADRGLDPLAARRPHLELCIRWMQEIRRFKPSTVSRRFSVTAGFYRACVIDSALAHSPAEYVRRPRVPAESPTLFRYFAISRLDQCVRPVCSGGPDLVRATILNLTCPGTDGGLPVGFRSSSAPIPPCS